jgi:hypothetical protein
MSSDAMNKTFGGAAEMRDEKRPPVVRRIVSRRIATQLNVEAHLNYPNNVLALNR